MPDSAINLLLRVASDTGDAEGGMSRLGAILDRFGKRKATADVDVDTAGAETHLALLDRVFARIDGRNLNVDVNVDRDGAAAAGAERLGGGLLSLGSRARGLDVDLSGLSGAVSGSKLAFLAAAPAVYGLVQATIALGPALVSAGAGLGALGIAAGAAGLAVKALQVGGVAEFTRDSKIAGTASYAFAQSLNATKNSLIGVTSGGVDAFFARVGPALEQASGKAGVLRGAFTSLGNQAATAAQRLLSFATTPAILAQLQRVVTGAGGAFRPLTTIAESLFRVLLTIAQAAMPLLIRALNSAAGGAKRFADGFGTVPAVRQRIEGMIATLATLGRIAGNVGSAIAGVFRAAAGGANVGLAGIERFTAAMARGANTQGFANGVQTALRALKGLSDFAINVGRIIVGALRIVAPVFAPIVAAIRGGANALGDFANKGSTINRLRPIFESIGQAVGSVIKYAGEVFTRFIDAIKPAEPILKPLAAFVSGALKAAFASVKPVIDVLLFAIKGIATVIGAVGTVLSPFTGSIRAIGGIVGSVFSGTIVGAVGKVLQAFKFIPGIIGPILSVFGAGLRVLGEVMGVVYNGAVRLVSGAIRPLEAAFNGAAGIVKQAATVIGNEITTVFGAVESVTRTVWGAVRSVIEGVWNFLRGAVGGVFGGIKSAIEGAFNGIKSVTSSVWNFVKGVVEGVWRDFKAGVGVIFGGIRSVIEGAWNAIKSATSTAWNAVKSIVEGVFNGLKSFVSGAVHAISSVISDVWNGLKSIASRTFGAITGAVSGVFGKVKDVVIDGVKGALGAVGSFFGNFADAGFHLIENLISGLGKGFSKAFDFVKSKLHDLTKLLPFSEPKDASSPLRGLAKSGTAIGLNLAAGVPAGMEALKASIAANLPTAPAIGGQFASRGIASGAALGAGAGMNQTINVAAPNVVMGAGLPNTAHWTADLEQQLRSRGGIALAG